VFGLADQLVSDIYRVSAGFPRDERFGLQGQLRRAAVSTASNIVEGSARRTTREDVNFLNIAAGSAAETGYLIDVSHRLGLLASTDSEPMGERCAAVCASLQALIRALSREP
jgi:four helix bundle protein